MKKNLIYIFIITAVVFIAACNQLIPVNRGTSRVTVETGINPAASRAAVSDVASFRLRVTAEGMTTVEQNFTDEIISLEIKAGSARKFTLQALDAEGNVLFSGSNTIDLTAGEPVELLIELGYAGFYVTFITNGGTSLPVQYVEKDGLVSIQSVPAKDGFSFGGWYTDSSLSLPWSISSNLVTSDIILFAKWEIDNLIARWTFDGTIDDIEGGYNATGAPSYSISNPGKGFSQSLYFDGTHMLSVPAIELAGQFSLSVWVNFSGGTTINTILSNNSDVGTSDGFKLYINYWNTSDRALFINTGDGTNQSDTNSATDIVPVDSWHHIVFLVDKTNGTGQIYLDDVSVVTGSLLDSFATNTDLKIGGIDYSTSGTFFFNGYMSDMRLYSVILNETSISEIYNE